MAGWRWWRGEMTHDSTFPRGAGATGQPPRHRDSISLRFVRDRMQPPLAAPSGQSGPVHWARQNLFSSWGSTLATLVAAYVLWLVLPPVLNFALFEAVWSGDGRAACTSVSQG